MKRIIDNSNKPLHEHLAGMAENADVFRLVSAYFTIYGYDLLKEPLNSVGKTRFLYGDPASVASPDPAENTPKAFMLTEESGLQPKNQLRQKALAKECEEWASREDVEIRSVKTANFLHGKMYHAQKDKEGNAVAGSSNFTRGGLGGSKTPNLELNTLHEGESAKELREWFDALWNDKKRVEDVKQKVLDALRRLGQEHAPELIYYKTLYALFYEELQARREESRRFSSIRLEETKIWRTLFSFQQDGAKTAISRMTRFNGCILADSVGLGKTYTALAIIKYYELRNQNVLVLCPKKLSENWKIYSRRFENPQNPFKEDGFNYAVLHHSDLSRTEGYSNGINLRGFAWGNYDVVVVDESHNFRNASVGYIDDKGKKHISRYERLLKEVVGEGAKTQVLLLSATPVNTSLIDLRNQISVITAGKPDAYMETLGIPNIETLLNQAQKVFLAWEKESEEDGRDKEKLLSQLGGGFLRLLANLSIARSRRHIKNFYNDDEKIKKMGSFPPQKPIEQRYPKIAENVEFSYEKLADKIEEFSLAMYCPSHYVKDAIKERQLTQEKDERRFNQEDRENFLIGMVKVNYLKRLESSVNSLRLTLQRAVKKMDDLLKEIERYNQKQSGALFVDIEPEGDENENDDFVVGGKIRYQLSSLKLSDWESDLRADKEKLEEALAQVSEIDAAHDNKLNELKQDIRKRLAEPNKNKDGEEIRKIIVFTAFKDTAEYLYENLRKEMEARDVDIAVVGGDYCKSSYGKEEFGEVLRNFSPRSHNRNTLGREIDILIATDCLSEGQNLQDCDTVLNYDIHWNPVRLVQRFGRIDRIGSRNKFIRTILYWPVDNLERYLRLNLRVQARMALLDTVATGDSDPLETEKKNLIYRDKQLASIREASKLDSASLGDEELALGDFSFDAFIEQLLKYLKEHEKDLRNVPNGAYAVVAAKGEAKPAGAIFLLRLREHAEDKTAQAASPVYPYYLAYASAAGLRLHCGQPQEILRRFNDLASGHNKPLQALCDRFDEATENGKNMSEYDAMLNAATSDIAKKENKTAVSQLFDPRGKIMESSKRGDNPNNFELIAWLAITSPAE